MSDAGRDRPFSIFRKRLHPGESRQGEIQSTFAGTGDPAHWNYWLRESEAYGSELLVDMADGLRAPRCFAREVDDGGATLWLEDVQGLPASQWPVRRFALAMRHLGRFQARFVAGEPLPAYSWLSKGFLRAWIPEPKDSDDVRYGRLVQRRDDIVAVVENAPRTICHCDLRTANLFAAAADDATVVLDWSSVGFGALGEDVAGAVFDSFWMFGMDADLLAPTIEAAIEGYIDGLIDAGWDGDDQFVRWTYATVAGLRFGLLAEHVKSYDGDDAACRTLEARYGEPASTIIGRRAAVCEAALKLSDQALGHANGGRSSAPVNSPGSA